MTAGKFSEHNQRKIVLLTENDWRVALKKCKNHIKLRLKQKTLSGAHSASALGADPIDHYLGMAYEKILLGEWKWQDEYSLAEQMIRIFESSKSKVVEKAGTIKSEAIKIAYTDEPIDCYCHEELPLEESELKEYENKLKAIEDAIEGEEDLQYMVEALKEGRKRVEIAAILGIGLRQFDKLREKFLNRVKKHYAASNGKS